MRDLTTEFQEQLSLLGDDYPEVRNELWNLFKTMKKPDSIIIKDDSKEKILEKAIEELEGTVTTQQDELKELYQILADMELATKEAELADELLSINLEIANGDEEPHKVYFGVSSILIVLIACLWIYGIFHAYWK